MKDPTFRGVYPALTTPFRADLSLDIDGCARLTEAVVADGVHGIVVNGCTGESFSPGTFDCGTGLSTMGQIGSPVSRLNE